MYSLEFKLSGHFNLILSMVELNGGNLLASGGQYTGPYFIEFSYLVWMLPPHHEVSEACAHAETFQDILLSGQPS